MGQVDPATLTNAYKLDHSHRLQNISARKFFELDPAGQPTNPRFYDAFAELNRGSNEQKTALKFLNQLPGPEEMSDGIKRSELPLFDEACAEYTQAVVSARLLSPFALESQREALLCLFSSIHNDRLPLTTRESWIKVKEDLNEKGAFAKLRNLDKVNLSGYDLSRLNFSKSHMVDWDLTGADLTDVVSDGADVKGVRCDSRTVMTKDTFANALNADQLILVDSNKIIDDDEDSSDEDYYADSVKHSINGNQKSSDQVPDDGNCVIS